MLQYIPVAIFTYGGSYNPFTELYVKPLIVQAAPYLLW